MAFAERRKYPRIPETVSCHVSVGPSAFVTKTVNLSCGGVLCRFPQTLAPMTKLDIVLQLPGAANADQVQLIHCVGVVVRQEPQDGKDGFSFYVTAIYFSEIKPEDRKKIAEFILQSMLSNNRRRP